jgi:hypothetical protein
VRNQIAGSGVLIGGNDATQLTVNSTGALVAGTCEATILKGTQSVSGTSNTVNMEATAPGIWWYETDATSGARGWKMYATAGQFRFYITNDSGTVGDAIFTVARSTSDLQDTTFYRSGVQVMNTQQRDGTGNTSALAIRDHQGTLHDAGFNVLDQEANNTSFTLAAQHCGMCTIKSTSTARTITLPASGDTDFPVDGVFTVYNRVTSGTGGNYTINSSTNGVTLYWLDGTTLTGGTSTNRTLGPGGVATIHRHSTTIYVMYGNGIS